MQMNNGISIDSRCNGTIISNCSVKYQGIMGITSSSSYVSITSNSIIQGFLLF